MIQEIRLPRALILLLVGAALGLAGAAAQAASRSTLVTPDLLGIPQGAALGALILGISLGDPPGTAGVLIAFLGALFGAALVALVIAVSSASARGGPGAAEPARVVLMGITVGLAITALTVGLLSAVGRADPGVLLRFAVGGWSAAGGPRREDLLPPALGLLLAIPAALRISAGPRGYALGDEVLHGLGGRPARLRVLAVLVVVPAVAGAVAATGPVVFIALAAPPLARRLAGTDRPMMIGAAGFGATLTILCDAAAQSLPPWPVPVGAVTATAGGLVLAVLVLRISGRTTT